MESTACITKIVKERHEEPVTVYNLAVKDWVSYFVGNVRVYVHNGLGYTPGDPINIDGAINNGQPLNKHQIIKDPQNFKAKKQPANSSADLLNPDGSVKRRRYYGADGNAKMDIDFNHTDDGTHEFPHIHIWDWSQKKPRQKGRK